MRGRLISLILLVFMLVIIPGGTAMAEKLTPEEQTAQLKKEVDLLIQQLAL